MCCLAEHDELRVARDALTKHDRPDASAAVDVHHQFAFAGRMVSGLGQKTRATKHLLDLKRPLAHNEP